MHTFVARGTDERKTMGFFDEEEEIVSWLDDMEEPEIAVNAYIADSENATDLLMQLLSSTDKRCSTSVKKITGQIHELFQIYSDTVIEDKMRFYHRFMALCSRLREQHKIQKLMHKAVIGVGGKFSAGKSKFLNAVTGLGQLLPEETAPTTSIPTYIIKGRQTRITANNIYGNACVLDTEQLQAMTHEFFKAYRIGFSSFVESIFIEGENCTLSERLALLDTPGYNKFDSKTKETVTDKRKALEQLRISDHLIWLADADNGTLTQEDLAFMEDLHMTEPILIVLNKCDKKSDEQIGEILEQTASDVTMYGLRCYGIVAYSALEQKEYGGIPFEAGKSYSGTMIADFFTFAASSKNRNNDILTQFEQLKTDFLKMISDQQDVAVSMCADLRNEICRSEQVKNIRSLAQLWAMHSQQRSQLQWKQEQSVQLLEKIETQIRRYLRGNKE